MTPATRKGVVGIESRFPAVVSIDNLRTGGRALMVACRVTYRLTPEAWAIADEPIALDADDGIDRVDDLRRDIEKAPWLLNAQSDRTVVQLRHPQQPNGAVSWPPDAFPALRDGPTTPRLRPGMLVCFIDPAQPGRMVAAPLASDRPYVRTHGDKPMNAVLFQLDVRRGVAWVTYGCTQQLEAGRPPPLEIAVVLRKPRAYQTVTGKLTAPSGLPPFKAASPLKAASSSKPKFVLDEDDEQPSRPGETTLVANSRPGPSPATPFRTDRPPPPAPSRPPSAPPPRPAPSAFAPRPPDPVAELRKPMVAVAPAKPPPEKPVAKRDERPTQQLEVLWMGGDADALDRARTWTRGERKKHRGLYARAGAAALRRRPVDARAWLADGRDITASRAAEAWRQQGSQTLEPMAFVLAGNLSLDVPLPEQLLALRAAMGPHAPRHKPIHEALEASARIDPSELTPVSVLRVGINELLAAAKRSGVAPEPLRIAARETLVRARRYAELDLLGGPHVVARWRSREGGDDRAFVAYLPKGAESSLPLLASFPARIAATMHPRQDPSEPGAFALRIHALGRVLEMGSVDAARGRRHHA